VKCGSVKNFLSKVFLKYPMKAPTDEELREIGKGVLLGLSVFLGIVGGVITALWVNNYPQSDLGSLSLGLVLLGIGLIITAYVLESLDSG